MTNVNEELGRMVLAGGIETNLHDVGTGEPVVLVHGSGPGVTAWANWRTVMPELSKHRRVIANVAIGCRSSKTRILSAWSMIFSPLMIDFKKM